MGQTKELTVRLSEDAVEFLRSKVSNGEYGSESDVIQEGLETLRADAQERERWEREVFLPAYDRYLANPEKVFTVEEVKERLEARRRERRERSKS
jgi:antitoxin ParD1/3/4